MSKPKSLLNIFMAFMALAVILIIAPGGCGYSKSKTYPAQNTSPHSSSLIRFKPVGYDYITSVSRKIELTEELGGGEVLVTFKISDFERKGDLLEANVVIENHSGQKVNFAAGDISVSSNEQPLVLKTHECSSPRAILTDEVNGCRAYFEFSSKMAESMKSLKVEFSLSIGSEKQSIDHAFEIVL